MKFSPLVLTTTLALLATCQTVARQEAKAASSCSDYNNSAGRCAAKGCQWDSVNNQCVEITSGPVPSPEPPTSPTPEPPTSPTPPISDPCLAYTKNKECPRSTCTWTAGQCVSTFEPTTTTTTTTTSTTVAPPPTTTTATTTTSTTTSTVAPPTTTTSTTSTTVAPPTTTTTVAPPAPTTFTCPAVGAGSSVMTFSAGSAIGLTKSLTDTVCTISLVSPQNAAFKPVARSYNRRDWEPYAGDFSTVTYACDETTCTVILPALPTVDHSYQMTALTHAPTADEITARFLEQATFGTRRADVTAFPPSPAAWIKEQQDQIPATSHRAHFRARANYRTQTSQRFGRVTKPCEMNTRYRAFAFTDKDGNFDELLFRNHDGMIYLLFDGQARTVVQSITGTVDGVDQNFPTADGHYEVCRDAEDEIGSTFRLRHPDTGVCCDMSFNGQYGNPQVYFDAAHPPTNEMLTLDNKAEPIDQALYPGSVITQELILTSDLSDVTCDNIPTERSEVTARIDRVIVGTWNGQFFLHDPRPVFRGNTPETPLSDGGWGVLNETRFPHDVLYTGWENERFMTECANVPRTFLNEDSCVLSYESNVCTPQETPDATFYLEGWSFHRVHSATGGSRDPNKDDGPETRYIYAIDNLKNGEGTESPCTTGARSRWRKMPNITYCENTSLFFDTPPPTVSTTTQQIFSNLIAISPDPNEYVQDVIFPQSGSQCDIADVDMIDFLVTVGTDCYQNVHPDTLQVYDFTNWIRGGSDGAALHPGGADKIKKWGKWNSGTYFQLMFPSNTHPMERYYGARDNDPALMYAVEPLIKLGRLGDRLNWFDLPPELAQNEAVAARYGVVPPVPTGGAAIVCGSPNEVANEPLSLGGRRERGFDIAVDVNWTTFGDDFQRQRTTVWTDIALYSPDQLRQRMAWALSQILVISPGAIDSRDSTETFSAYYDIFVRHAFGNYRDILKEVAYSPMMAEMLSYMQSQSTFYVWQTENVVEFADENFAREIMQLFTIGLYLLNDDGTQRLDTQGVPLLSYTNFDITEYARVWTGFDWQARRGNTEESSSSKNRIDPMQIRIDWRDHLPKMGLNRKYIGEGTALCSLLGSKHFLKTGATFRLLGSRPKPELIHDPDAWDSSYRPALDSSSALYARLCNSSGGFCRYHAKYELTSDLACTGWECDVDSLRVFSVDGMFYEYVRKPCVNQAFFADPKVIETSASSTVSYMCGDPATEVASTVCCDIGTNTAYDFAAYPGERRTFAEAQLVCSQNGKEICSTPSFNGCSSGTCDESLYYWTSRSCQQQVKINFEGDVAIVHEPGEADVTRMVSADTKVFFRVDWSSGGNPFSGDYDSTCSSLGCAFDLYDGLCLCDASVSGQDVTVGNGGHRFRNPVHFIALSDPEVRDAHYETDAALDQYFEHPNTAPFLAIRFAQRFGISNPSPRYINAITDAFRSGSYLIDGQAFGTGSYGDLAATVAAVLLDSEAHSIVLDADPAHGALFEPYLKMTRLMRSLEFEMFADSPYIRFRDDLEELLGQEPHKLPSVFSFFRPEYSPEGPVSLAGFSSPEAQVLTAPKVISFLNGVFSYLKYGLENSYDGFGFSHAGGVVLGDFTNSYGANNFVPSSTAVVDELAMLLTSGRLSQENRQVIQSAYDFTIGQGKTQLEATINTMLLVATSPEFHSSGLFRKNSSQRTLPPPPPEPTQPYKAVVYVMLSGGMDSYSMLVPHTCSGSPSPRDQYEQERGDLAFDEALGERTVTIPASGQVCFEFALHDELPFLRDMYNNKDLTFMANTGVINRRGMTKENYRDLTKTQLFAHNAMQDEIRKVDPFDDAPGTGVLGRAADTLADLFSVRKVTINDPSIAVVGNPGGSPPPLIVSERGAVEFNRRSWREDYFDLESYASDLNAETELMSSIFSETWASEYTNGVENSKFLKSTLDAATLSSVWDNQEEDELWRKFSMVSKLIQQRSTRGSERDVFFVDYGGWDHHSNLKQNIREKFEPLNRNLKLFVGELKAQQIWNDVTIVFTSDFARTITGNSGQGSDHAWGGHYWMMGGAVDGGRVIGEYPADITPEGPLNIGRGRIIPTTSWDSIWNGIAEWFGVPTDRMDAVLPNRDSTVDAAFPLYGAADLFV